MSNSIPQDLYSRFGQERRLRKEKKGMKEGVWRKKTERSDQPRRFFDVPREQRSHDDKISRVKRVLAAQHGLLEEQSGFSSALAVYVKHFVTSTRHAGPVRVHQSHYFPPSHLALFGSSH